jgi:hypothetical protein
MKAMARSSFAETKRIVQNAGAASGSELAVVRRWPTSSFEATPYRASHLRMRLEWVMRQVVRIVAIQRLQLLAKTGLRNRPALILRCAGEAGASKNGAG